MDKREFVTSFWAGAAAQDAAALRSCFAPDAVIRWNNTNEQFTAEEYIIANCEYPGAWRGEVERVVLSEGLAVTVTRVWLSDNSVSFHATSFFEFLEGKIAVLNEYWGDDGIAPQWRMEKKIGRPIQ